LGPVVPALAKQWTVISLDYYGSGETTDDGSVLSLNGHSALRNGKWADVRSVPIAEVVTVWDR